MRCTYCERGISDYVVRCPYCNSFLGGPRKIPTSAAKSPVSSNGHPKSASSQTKGTIKVPSSGDKGKIRESPAKKAPGDSVLPSSTSSTAKAPRNNRRLIGLIAAICIILLLASLGYIYFGTTLVSNSKSTLATNYNYPNARNTPCTAHSGTTWIGGPNGSLYLIVNSLVQKFETSYCTNVMLVPGPTNTSGISGVVGGDLDVAFVPNYALYQQAEQSIKTSGQGIDLLAYQVGRNGSSNTFWLVTTQHGGGLSNYLITFFQANFAN